MEALVLAGGKGSRLQAISEIAPRSNKCMLRVGGIPLIEHSLATATRVGARAIVIVVGALGDEVAREFGASYRGIPLRYVVQERPRGVVDAMEQGRRALRDSEFLLCLGDEILDAPRHAEMLRRFRDARLFASCGVVRADDRHSVRKTYALIAKGNGERGRILRLIEKPRVPRNDWMGTGNCLMRLGIFDHVARTPINAARGEKELPDLIQCAIDEGQRVEYFRVAHRYVNVNTPQDVLLAHALVSGEVAPTRAVAAGRREIRL